MRVHTGVFQRQGADTLSERTFFLALGLSVAYGLLMTAFIAHKVAATAFVPNLFVILIFGLAVPIIGSMIALKSDNPAISFIGYNMVCIPFGVVLAPIVNIYSPDLIRNAFGMTCCVVITMCTLSSIYPQFFARIGGILSGVLLAFVLIFILQLFLGIRLAIFDWIGAGLFSLYIGYDWYRANNVPKTLDNAVDISLDLYLDIVNLFLFILAILGRRD
jgi:FtsH-binding integral membrane protein